jgi:hypothetical protein
LLWHVGREQFMNGVLGLIAGGEDTDRRGHNGPPRQRGTLKGKGTGVKGENYLNR